MFERIQILSKDVKATFLNGDLKEEVHTEQLEYFDLFENKDCVYKFKEFLCGLKKAPRAWYARMDHYLQLKCFKRGVVDNNLYIKMDKDSLLITLVYVDDLIFGSNNNDISHGFAAEISKEFEMSIIGEFSFFL